MRIISVARGNLVKAAMVMFQLWVIRRTGRALKEDYNCLFGLPSEARDGVGSLPTTKASED
jgi:hypothetical protein